MKLLILKKKSLQLIIFVCFLVLAARTGYAQGKTKLIDDFEEKYAAKGWWVFGNVQLSLRENNETLKADLGDYSLGVVSQTADWYGGGFGRNIPDGFDIGNLKYFCVDVWGDGTKKGIIGIKIVEDDNDNNEAEADIDYTLLYDDEWTYKRIINWKGWKRLVISLDRFKDSNKNIGDDEWNPQKTRNSQGILKINIICLSQTQNDNVKFKVDNIGFCQ
jgi:hypothetical protein